jgi:hypothetical protein
VFLVPGSTSELEEVCTGICCLVHRCEQRRRCAIQGTVLVENII